MNLNKTVLESVICNDVLRKGFVSRQVREGRLYSHLLAIGPCSGVTVIFSTDMGVCDDIRTDVEPH